MPEKLLSLWKAATKTPFFQQEIFPEVKTASVNTINAYDVLKYNTLVVTKEAVAQI